MKIHEFNEIKQTNKGVVTFLFPATYFYVDNYKETREISIHFQWVISPPFLLDIDKNSQQAFSIAMELRNTTFEEDDFSGRAAVTIIWLLLPTADDCLFVCLFAQTLNNKVQYYTSELWKNRGKCPQGKFPPGEKSAGKKSSGEMSVRGKVRRGNVLGGKVLKSKWMVTVTQC
jgi:hypothetical protein